mmetsp:Transcript_39227/g.117188  ORF Transcript_39227/g.117188 Transcript_39227/m.117188 type:complete len:202 (-) Transcript_39227:311-916(-)
MPPMSSNIAKTARPSDLSTPAKAKNNIHGGPGMPTEPWQNPEVTPTSTRPTAKRLGERQLLEGRRHLLLAPRTSPSAGTALAPSSGRLSHDSTSSAFATSEGSSAGPPAGRRSSSAASEAILQCEPDFLPMEIAWSSWRDTLLHSCLFGDASGDEHRMPSVPSARSNNSELTLGKLIATKMPPITSRSTSTGMTWEVQAPA